jgi:hypothetical protein
MTSYVNKTELRVVGMSRSGNHAIMQWILSQVSQLEGRACVLNCAECKSNPFHTSRPMENGHPYRANYPDFDLESEQAGHFSARDFLIFSHEDSFLRCAFSSHYEEFHDQYVGASRRRIDVLILRDPFNLFASRIRSDQGVVSSQVAMRIWRQHAREFLGMSSFMRQEKLVISYNRWFLDIAYRQYIAERIGLSFTDAGIKNVAACGGGSSFDGMKFNGHANQMGVLKRWKHYMGSPEYQTLFDPATIELSERIFGHIPGTEGIIQSSYALPEVINA